MDESKNQTSLSFWYKRGLLTCSPFIPDLSPFKGEEFYKHYELVNHHYFRIGEESRESEYIGKNEKICSLCSKKSPEVTFKKKSHIIPESLGNKIYFSNEECDDCNEKFGNELENELAKYFNLNRVWRGVKGKKSEPKIKLKNDGDIVYKDGEGIRISANLEENKDYEIDEKNNLIKLHLAPVPLKPAKAILSILKSAWLFMSKETRESAKEILDYLNKEKQKLEYYNINIPGTITHPSLYIYKNISNINSPKIIIRFDFQDMITVWATSDSNKVVFPPIHFLQIHKSNNVKLQMFTFDNIEKVVTNKNNTWELGFAKLERPSENNSSKKKLSSINHTLQKSPCELIHKNKKIDCYIRFYRIDFELTHAALFGQNIPFQLDFKIYHLDKSKQEMKYIPKYSSITLEKFHEYNEFYKYIQNSDSNKISLVGDFFNFDISDPYLGTPDTVNIRENINYLMLINKEFNKQFRLPNILSSSDSFNIKTIGKLLNGETVNAKKFKFSISGLKNDLNDFIDALKSRQEDMGIQGIIWREFNVFNNSLLINEINADLREIINIEIEHVEKYVNHEGKSVDTNINIIFKHATLSLPLS